MSKQNHSVSYTLQRSYPLQGKDKIDDDIYVELRFDPSLYSRFTVYSTYDGRTYFISIHAILSDAMEAFDEEVQRLRKDV